MTDTSWSDGHLPNNGFRVANLIMQVEDYMPEDASRVYDAFLFAAEAHDGIMRRDGSPYITHPLEVARTLADLHMDVDVICAALLHDVVEDCAEYSIEDIDDEFGHATANLVDGVTKLTGEHFANKEAALIATFRNLMKTMTVDFRVVLIKLADRLHNLSTMSKVPQKTRIKKADESFQLYIPLARRMGMNQLRRQLQELALKAKHPWRTQVLEKVIAGYEKQNDEKHAAILENLVTTFEKNQLKASVFRWQKNIYRVYLRLKEKGVKLNPKTESLDIRILVSNRAECYQALCILHELYRPVIGTFKDFIASPNIYGFQALETHLLTPNQQHVKVQIQTENMYRIAQLGVAAKWYYPELKKRADIPHKALQKWINQVDEIYRFDVDVDDFFRDIQADLFLTEIYVLTPKGKTISLPHGACAIDFAYAIHTDLGNHCVEARVNGKRVPLKMPLYNGANVEIIRSEMASPRASWLNIVATAKAKASIRAWLNKRKDVEFIALGKQVFNAALQQYKDTLSDAHIDPEKMTALLQTLNLATEGELWEAIGKGEQCGKLVVLRLFSDEKLVALPEKNKQPMMISGTEGLLVNLQPCCHPVEGDRITAKITADQGLEVHRVNCPTLRNADISSDDYLSVSWNKKEKAYYVVPLDVSSENQIGILSTITALMEKHDINIESVAVETEKQGTKIIHFLIQVTGQKHLQKILNSIKKQAGILSVERPF